MTQNEFRRIALAMQNAVEGAHMGHPDFRVHGRIFATLHPDGKQGMVKLTPDEQAEFLREAPSAFSPASGAWGRQGCTMVLLAAADEATVGEAMTLAWQETSRKPPARKSSEKKTSRPAGRRRKR